jgi:hypothetical protein
MNMTNKEKRQLALELIKSSSKTLAKSIDDPRRIDSVTWRLADALGLLSESEGSNKNPGLDYPTGRGYRLTKKEAS